MATLFDFKEPNGLGMFSQAGRVTSAKYSIFKKKDEIFNNQKKVIKVTALPVLALDISKKENQPKRVKEIREEAGDAVVLAPETPKKPMIPPFARQLSREEVNKIKEVKTTTPTHGLYTPKFSSIQRSTSILVNYDKEKARPASSGKMRPVVVTQEELARPLADKPKKKVLGSISFKFQTARGEFLKRADTQPEHTLDHNLTPPSLTRTRTVGSFKIQSRPQRASESSRRSVRSFSINRTLTFGSPKAQIGSSGPSSNQFNRNRTFRKLTEAPLNLPNGSPETTEESGKIEKTPKKDQADGEFVDLLFFTQNRPSSRISMDTPSQKLSEINKCSEEGSEADF